MLGSFSSWLRTKMKKEQKAKILILGLDAAGKTTLTRLIVGKKVNLEYVPTITADIANYDKLGSRSVVLWDFAGQIQFTSLWDSLLKGTGYQE